jgi:hypothetical protein
MCRVLIGQGAHKVPAFIFWVSNHIFLHYIEWQFILLCLKGVVGLDGEIEGFDLKRTILFSNFGTYHMTWILESPCIPTLFTGYSAFLNATVRVK